MSVGAGMKEWVSKISAISLQSQADGHRYWGRLPGTVYDTMTMDLMVDELERLGLETTRVPHTIPRDWSPTFWEASYTSRMGRRSHSRRRFRLVRRLPHRRKA